MIVDINDYCLSYKFSEEYKLRSGLREEILYLDIDFLGKEILSKNTISDIKERIDEIVNEHDFIFDGHINYLVKNIRKITNFMPEDHFNISLKRVEVGGPYSNYGIHEEFQSTNGVIDGCSFGGRLFDEYEIVYYDAINKKITVDKSEGSKTFYEDNSHWLPRIRVIGEINNKFKRLIELKENQRKYKKIKTLRNVYKNN